MGKGQFSLLTAHWEAVISFAPFRGLFVVRKRRKTWGRAAGDGELLERRRRPDVRKVKVSQRSTVKNLAPLQTLYLKEVQSVVDALAMLQYDDGTPRQPGYLGIWTNGSTWVVRISDKDADAQLTAEGRSLDEALDTLDVLLGTEDAPWEPVARRRKKGG